MRQEPREAAAAPIMMAMKDTQKLESIVRKNRGKKSVINHTFGLGCYDL